MFKISSSLLLVVLLGLVSHNGVLAGSTVSWSYRGTVQTGNYSQTLNVGDSLTLQCQGFSTTAPIAQTETVFQALIVTASAASGSVTVTASTTAAQSLTTAAGTLVWDPVNGGSATYSHWNVIQTVTAPGNTAKGRALLNIYVPYVRTVDAGTYYCNYGDGSANGLTTGISSSNQFVLTVTTKRRGWRKGWDWDDSSSAVATKGSKLLQYSALLVTSSKLVL